MPSIVSSNPCFTGRAAQGTGCARVDAIAFVKQNHRMPTDNEIAGMVPGFKTWCEGQQKDIVRAGRHAAAKELQEINARISKERQREDERRFYSLRDKDYLLSFIEDTIAETSNGATLAQIYTRARDRYVCVSLPTREYSYLVTRDKVIEALNVLAFFDRVYVKRGKYVLGRNAEKYINRKTGKRAQADIEALANVEINIPNIA